MQKQTRATHPWLRRDSWTLWEWWVLATVVGGLVGVGMIALASTIASNTGTVNTVAVLHVVGALEGAALGLAQWLALRRYIKHIGWWIGATAIGAMIAWLIGSKVIVVLTLIFFGSVLTESTRFDLLEAVFFLGLWVGAVLGLAQWFVLRTHVRKGLTWVLANAFAWGAGLLVAFIGATFVQPGKFTPQTAFIYIGTGATSGVIVGAITGIALVWLLKPRLLRHH